MSDWTTLTEKTSRDNVDKVLIGEPANTSKYLLISTLIAGLGGGGGGVYPYVFLRDKKAQGTNGGTFTSGARRTRDLTEEVVDTDNICSLASNQFTLDAGTYLFFASVPAHAINAHQSWLYNASDSQDELIGSSEYAHSSVGTTTRSVIVGRFTIASQKTFEIQHQCGFSRADRGLGLACGFGEEVYTCVELWKES